MLRLAEASLGAGNGEGSGVDLGVCARYRDSTIDRQSRSRTGSEHSPSE
jgi:hypothetical protein